jgi:hypothetical protein
MVSLRAEGAPIVEEEPEVERAEPEPSEVAVAEVVAEPEREVDEPEEELNEEPVPPPVEDEPEPEEVAESEPEVDEPEVEVDEEPEPPSGSRFVHSEDPPQAQSRFDRSDQNGAVSLRSATFEDLRGLGMSVTQARRVLHYRDERGLDSVAGLEQVPGLPRDFRAELVQKLSD